MESYEVRVLGPVEVVRSGVPVPLSALRQRTLVAVLAMAAPGSMDPDRLESALWSATDRPAAPRAAVHAQVFRLRRALPGLIATDGDAYRLTVPAEDVDAHRFQQLCREARVAGTDAQAAMPLIESALTLWRGAPFTGVVRDWLDSRYGTGLVEDQLELRERQADLRLAAGEVEAILPDLIALAEQHPLRESLWLRLLIALARVGRAAEALERYECLRSTLADELGTDPGPPLRELHAELLAGGGPTPAAAGSTPTLPEAEATPRQLPLELIDFTGRERELAELDAALTGTRERPEIVVLHGTGGAGKTSLAVRWAHRNRDRFPDGQLYVNLRGFGPDRPVTPEEALHGLLWSLGVTGEQIPKSLDERSALLRSLMAGRRILLLLDNARDPGQVRPLLPGSSSHVVITSRSQLTGLAVREQARQLEVGPLDPRDSIALLAETLGSADVAADGAELERLARACIHLPLALAVAAKQAVRVPGGTVSDLLEQLRESSSALDLLELSDEEASVRSVLTWSYRALDEETRRCFRMVGLHPGPSFSVGSMAAVLGVTPARARQLIVRLIDGNLARPLDRRRYEAHDLLRALAVELCQAEETEQQRAAALERLHSYTIHTAAVAHRLVGLAYLTPEIDPILPGIVPDDFADADRAVEWFDLELVNLRALVRNAAANGSDRAAYQIAQLLPRHLRQRYHAADLLELQELGLASARRRGDRTAIAISLLQLAWVIAELGELGPAEDHNREALALFEQEGHDAGQTITLTNLGIVLWSTGRGELALDYHERAARTAARTDDPELQAGSLGNLAMSLLELGRVEEAAENCRRSLALVPESSTYHRYALDTLGQLLLQLEQHDEAETLLRRTLTLSRAAADRWLTCVSQTHLGDVLAARGRTPEARECWTEALNLFDTLGSPDQHDLRRADLVERLGEGAPTRLPS